MAAHQRNGHSERRPNRVGHLIGAQVDVQARTIPGTRLMIERGQKVLHCLAIRLQVDADNADVIARPNKSWIDLQRSLVRLHGLRGAISIGQAGAETIPYFGVRWLRHRGRPVAIHRLVVLRGQVE